MDFKYGLISVDDHVLEHPRVWADRLSKEKWGDRIPLGLVFEAQGTRIPARAEYIGDTTRCSALMSGDTVIHTVVRQ